MADRPGVFIALEGGEGAGKSTQIRHLAAVLEDRGITVVRTREPGGSAGAERIRELLVTGEADRWDGLTEVMLLSAARRDHIRRVIAPALAQGAWVLTDRFVGSTRAYQGYGHGVALERIDAIHALACDGLEPDLTLVLDLPVEIGLDRAGRRRAASTGEGARFEALDPAFHGRMRAGFLELAARSPARFRVVDADADEAVVAARVVEAIDGWREAAA